jgi:hypothetical protein
MRCRSYGAYRDLNPDSYKDFAPPDRDSDFRNLSKTDHTYRSERMLGERQAATLRRSKIFIASPSQNSASSVGANLGLKSQQEPIQRMSENYQRLTPYSASSYPVRPSPATIR